jgi:hypothetical protein
MTQKEGLHLVIQAEMLKEVWSRSVECLKEQTQLHTVHCILQINPKTVLFILTVEKLTTVPLNKRKISKLIHELEK